jgi:type II secretory pathway pseudopilin PulG
MRSPRRSGFTLVEALIAVVIAALSITSSVTAVLFLRDSLEVEKQRLIALNHARRQVELIRRNLFTSVSQQSVVLDNFDTPENPEDDLTATVSTNVWNVNPDGSTGSSVTAFPLEQRRRVLVEVDVAWRRTGRLDPITAHETIRTYVAPR